MDHKMNCDKLKKIQTQMVDNKRERPKIYASPSSQALIVRVKKKIRIRMSFIARYVYTYKEFVFVKEASTVQQNDSDMTKTQIIKKLKRTSK